ncbi:MAG TPA: hypothetical protein PKN96_07960 [Flavobacterium sp.]|uniref:hypothetical protein n=1 Tax=Flavobacterium sp. TaxID=239 RepID=UPI002BEA4B60|nr:hypothetical protein [Flavobacterium sp.]HNP33213.1 hypothetical protein [Flavobacterium sp.]
MRNHILLFTLLSINCFSQNFKFDKVLASGKIIKLKGKVSISDSLIVMDINGNVSNLKVKMTLDSPKAKQYYLVVPENSDSELRISLNENELDRKWFLITDTKDRFKGTVTTVTYFLKPEH